MLNPALTALRKGIIVQIFATVSDGNRECLNGEDEDNSSPSTSDIVLYSNTFYLRFKMILSQFSFFFFDYTIIEDYLVDYNLLKVS